MSLVCGCAASLFPLPPPRCPWVATLLPPREPGGALSSPPPPPPPPPLAPPLQKHRLLEPKPRFLVAHASHGVTLECDARDFALTRDSTCFATSLRSHSCPRCSLRSIRSTRCHSRLQ